MSEARIKIVAIAGSVRPGNLTKKVLDIVVDELKKQKDVFVDMIDPADVELLLPGQEGHSSAEKLQNMVKEATGIIVSTPEYHGSYSSAIKLVIDNLGFPSSLSGKPIALLGVASGQIGAIKALEHLRSVCSHVGGIVLPGPVSVSGVHHVIDEDGTCTDPKIDKRIRSLGLNLIDYIQKNICPRKALESIVREG